jgi:hypothetical protein
VLKNRYGWPLGFGGEPQRIGIYFPRSIKDESGSLATHPLYLVPRDLISRAPLQCSRAARRIRRTNIQSDFMIDAAGLPRA